MLITFTTKAYADITLFGDIARQLLTMMGHTGTVPGSILAEDIPVSLERLRRALAQHRPQADAAQEDGEDDEDEEEDEPPVDLARRAWPLIQLLEAAAHQGSDVLWKSS